MNRIEDLRLLKSIHEHIKASTTGTPTQFAQKLRVSLRKMYRLIEYLREHDAPIAFDRLHQTYYYTEKCELTIRIEKSIATSSKTTILEDY